jgi:hypothetical protein
MSHILSSDECQVCPFELDERIPSLLLNLAILVTMAAVKSWFLHGYTFLPRGYRAAMGFHKL